MVDQGGRRTYLGPVSEAVDAQGEVVPRRVVGLNQLPVAVEDGPAVLVLSHAAMAPAKVCHKAVVCHIPRLCTRISRAIVKNFPEHPIVRADPVLPKLQSDNHLAILESLLRQGHMRHCRCSEGRGRPPVLKG